MWINSWPMSDLPPGGHPSPSLVTWWTRGEFQPVYIVYGPISLSKEKRGYESKIPEDGEEESAFPTLVSIKRINAKAIQEAQDVSCCLMAAGVFVHRKDDN